MFTSGTRAFVEKKGGLREISIHILVSFYYNKRLDYLQNVCTRRQVGSGGLYAHPPPFPPIPLKTKKQY